MSLMERRAETYARPFCADIPGDQGVQEECAKRIPAALTHRWFRSVNFLIEFTMKLAMKLVVEPPMTVDLSFCSLLHEVSRPALSNEVRQSTGDGGIGSLCIFSY